MKTCRRKENSRIDKLTKKLIDDYYFGEECCKSELEQLFKYTIQHMYHIIAEIDTR